jgi:hypothetical protein
MADRTFTLAEAQQLLPVLEQLLRKAMTGKHELAAIDGEFQELSARVFAVGGMMPDIPRWARRRAERHKAEQGIKDSLAEIIAAGVQVKDLDIGLLDFPCLIEGKIVLLCWKMGEPAIAHWHGLEEGFAGRKPIDGRFGAGSA